MVETTDFFDEEGKNDSESNFISNSSENENVELEEVNNSSLNNTEGIDSQIEPLEQQAVEEPLPEQPGNLQQEEPILEQAATPLQEEPLPEQAATPLQEEPFTDQAATPLQEEPFTDQAATPMQEDPYTDQAVSPMQEEPLPEQAASPQEETPISEFSEEPLAPPPVEDAVPEEVPQDLTVGQKFEDETEKKGKLPDWLLPVVIAGLGVIVLAAALIILSKRNAQDKIISEAPEEVIINNELLQFEYKSTKIDDILRELSEIEDEIVEKIKKIPENKKIHIYGYADGSGPEKKEGDKPGNIHISKNRAEVVRDYFVRKYGLKRAKFKIHAMGSDDLKDKEDPYSGVNRRVVIKSEK